MKRILTYLVLFGCAIFALAQALPYVPGPIAAYIGTTGSWVPMAGSGTATLAYVPKAAGIYCSNDGTGHSGTWVPCAQPVPAVNPKLVYGYISGTSGTAFTSTVTDYGGGPTPTAAITITAIDLHLDTTPVGCTAPFAQTGLFDETAGAFVPGTTFTLANATSAYHISLATPQNIPAGHRLGFATAVAWNTAPACTTNGGGPHYTVEYTMTLT